MCTKFYLHANISNTRVHPTVRENYCYGITYQLQQPENRITGNGQVEKWHWKDHVDRGQRHQHDFTDHVRRVKVEFKAILRLKI
uniref:Secreted protein n=1 Tax=Echinococcus granulosus TaxID=6210 RepID=A0A068W7H7_ECHGR|nr:hypothetical protein EgrG_000761000 [Echinococcus granulosus]